MSPRRFAASLDGAPSRLRRRLVTALSLGPAASRLAVAGSSEVLLCCDDRLARYGMVGEHPLGTGRQAAFLAQATRRGLVARTRARAPLGPCGRDELLRFHTPALVDHVAGAEAAGLALLDEGDTPVFPGVHEAASTVVASALDALSRIMAGEVRASFQAVGGLHHAARNRCAGFCVFNDLGVVIETLRSVYGVRRVAYVDIDAHHGDGVYYAFESDPDLGFADIHEDGRHLYPGTGHAGETGLGAAEGSKLNLPLPPGAGDGQFLSAWSRVEAYLEAFRPEFIVFQCGADGLAGDPLTHLAYSPEAHRQAATSLVALARRHCAGRLMAFGGGGYHPENLAQAWSTVLDVLVQG